MESLHKRKFGKYYNGYSYYFIRALKEYIALTLSDLETLHSDIKIPV